MNSDIFGFYQVSNYKTYSKLEAIDYKNVYGGNIHWNFNDELFSSVDWTNEPQSSLWDLYKQRVKQIREKYDYCVLWYSGGSDSHNILHAWLDSGYKLDEIATTWNYETTGELYNHQNDEITRVVIPDINRLKAQGYDFKFRILNIADIGMSIFPELKTDLEYFFNYNFQISSLGKQFIRNKVKDYSDIINSGKRLAFIWGKEKPFLFHENNKYCFRFADNIDDVVGPYSQKNYKQGWFDELFYWSPDFPLIPIKQSHVIKNFLELLKRPNINLTEYFTSEEKRLRLNTEFFNVNDNFLYTKLKVSVLKKLIYPRWSKDIYINGKSPTRLLGWRDEWFVNSNCDQLQTAQASLLTYLNKTNQKQFRHSLLPFYSKPYWLEK